MNYKEIKKQIGVELRDSIIELNDSDNREHFKSLGVDIFNESERYLALINAIETAIERAQLYDQNKAKIEAFERILEESLNFYETYDTVDGLEHDFASEEFGEWVEEYIVDFHNLVAEEVPE